jgi:hypothetical protein
VPVEQVLGELMQRDNGLMRGKGGSMHLTSEEHGVMGSYAIIGAHLPIACGAAWRAQYKGDKDVTTCFFGDGRHRRPGISHEDQPGRVQDCSVVACRLGLATRRDAGLFPHARHPST